MSDPAGPDPTVRKDLTIITWDVEEETLMDGRTIEGVPLWKWLTGRDAGTPVPQPLPDAPQAI